METGSWGWARLGYSAESTNKPLWSSVKKILHFFPPVTKSSSVWLTLSNFRFPSHTNHHWSFTVTWRANAYSFFPQNCAWLRRRVSLKNMTNLTRPTKTDMPRGRPHHCRTPDPRWLDFRHTTHSVDLAPNDFEGFHKPTTYLPEINHRPQFLKKFRRICHRIPKKMYKTVHSMTAIGQRDSSHENHYLQQMWQEESQLHYNTLSLLCTWERGARGFKKNAEKNHKCWSVFPDSTLT